MKLRLRKLLHENGHDEVEGVTIEATANLKDWLIVTLDMNKYPPKQVTYLRKHLVEKLGEKVLVLPSDVEFCVFEEVPETD